MTASTTRVLCVDDEPRMLSVLRRVLGRYYDIDSASSGTEALTVIEHSAPYGVVISDLIMPGMDGIALLGRVRAVQPEATRVLLTGNADLHAAGRAVNTGQVFRFLCKPCPTDELLTAIVDAVEHHRLVTAQRVLLEETLQGSVAALLEALSLANPASFARANRLKAIVSDLIAADPTIEDPWQIELATMLSQIGAVTLPAAVTSKLHDGIELSPEETGLVDALPAIADRMLANIPRLEPIREIIRQQTWRYDGADRNTRSHPKTTASIGARILRVALDLDTLDARGLDRAASVQILRGRKGLYEPRLLEALATTAAGDRPHAIETAVHDLRPGMILMRDVTDTSGVLLVGNGQAVTDNLIDRLRNWTINTPINEPLLVRWSDSAAENETAPASSAA